MTEDYNFTNINMKIKSLLLSAVAMSMALVGCSQKETPISDIIVTVDPASITIDESAQDKAVSLKATRAWKAVINYEGDDTDWVTVTPARGEASNSEQTVTITAKANTGRDRVAKIKFNIGLDDATLTVTQEGPGGSSDPVYFNDFDKSAAVKDGNNWPYIYQSDCWKNERGTGIGTLEYVTDGNKATVRNNSNSTGSGVNNWFFGKAPAFFCVKKLTLPESSNYTLSCLAIRNVYGAEAGGSVFDHSQFKLYVSNDGKKWVELEYHFSNGDPDNAWDLLESTFTVPAGTGTLCIGVPTPSEASTYRIDDLKLDIAAAPGASIDFSKGIEISEFAGGGGDDPVTPGTPEGDGTLESPFNATAAYQTAKALEADKVTESFYYIKGFIKSVASVDTGTYGNANFYIVDKKDGNTEQFYCFQVMYLNGEKFTSADQIKVGDEVVVYAQLVNYKGNTPETNGKGTGRIVKLNGSGEDVHEDITTTKIAEVLAAANNTKINFNEAVIVAASTKGLVLTDAEGKQYVYAFNEKGNSIAAGKKVNLVCTRDEYNSMPELKITSIEETGSATVEHPAATDISANLDSYTSSKIEYVSITGTLSIASSKYYNIAVAGQTVQGSIESPVQDLNSLVGIPVTYTGYRIYNSSSSAGGKFVNIILTEFNQDGDYLSVSPLTLSVAAAGGEVQFNVSSSVDWTASSNDSGFTLDKTSGSGDATITVTCPENTAFEARTAKVTVSTTASVSTPSYEVTINQAAAQDPSVTVLELTNDEIKASLAGSSQSSNVYGDWTFSSESGDWTGNVNTSNKIDYVQIRNTLNAHLMTPAFAKEIDKIEVTACSTVSGSNPQSRDLYAIAADVDLTTPNKDTKYSSSVIENAYAGPANFTGTPNTEMTQTLDISAANVKQCKLICYNGAFYIKSVKVYLK